MATLVNRARALATGDVVIAVTLPAPADLAPQQRRRLWPAVALIVVLFLGLIGLQSYHLRSLRPGTATPTPNLI